MSIEEHKKPINKQQLRELFNYRDGSLYWILSPRSGIPDGSIAGCLGGSGYISITVNRKAYKAHRLIFLYHYGYLPQYIDHINRIKTDNRVENLRCATKSQNGINAKLRKDNTSGIKGVSKFGKKWIAFIKNNKKRIHLGTFEDIRDAETAVCKKRFEIYGEFAKETT